MEKVLADTAKRGVAPEQVAETIERALTADGVRRLQYCQACLACRPHQDTARMPPLAWICSIA